MSNNEFGEWSRPVRGELENRERAYSAAARRGGDRSLKARIDSALQASRLHYERTGRCYYLTEEIVASDTVFEELEDDEHFWDPKLLLPEGLTRQQLQEEHWEALRAAGAVIPPPHHMNCNGIVHGSHIMRNLVYPQPRIMESQLPGHGIGTSPLPFPGSQGHTPLVNPTLFPGVVAFNLGPHRPVPTSQANGIGTHTHENGVPDLSHGAGEESIATKALRKHVNPEAIEQVIGRTSVHLNGWLHDDSTSEETAEYLIRTFTNLDSDMRNPESSSDLLWPDADEHLDNEFDDAFDDDLDEDLDES